MPVLIVKKADIPPGRLRGGSRVHSLPEWKDVLEILAVGMKPYEAVEIKLLTNGIKLKVAPRSFANAVKSHCKRLNLAYDVSVKGKDDTGTVYIVAR